MKINPKDFRVREGADVDLDRWPTQVEKVYESKKHYREMLEGHVGRLSAQQQLLYASDRHAVLVILQAMDAAHVDACALCVDLKLVRLKIVAAGCGDSSCLIVQGDGRQLHGSSGNPALCADARDRLVIYDPAVQLDPS